MPAPADTGDSIQAPVVGVDDSVGQGQMPTPADTGGSLKKSERKMSPEARKVARKQRKQAAKVSKSRRPTVGRKPCGSCAKEECEELIRCQAAGWEGWLLVCGACWKQASGGVPDGDADHPMYKYGGLWRFRKTTQDAGSSAMNGIPSSCESGL